MPNWCECNLCVSGDVKELKKFKEQAKGLDEAKGKTDLSLNNFVPTPPELLDRSAPNDVDPEAMKAKYKMADWYTWRNKNWGTKWDIEAEITDEKPFELWYYFSSAWSPPAGAIETIARLFPKLKFSLDYCEPGMGFKGQFVVKKDKIIENYTRNITPKEYKAMEDGD